jgi:hypothetical protein
MRSAGVYGLFEPVQIPPPTPTPTPLVTRQFEHMFDYRRRVHHARESGASSATAPLSADTT